MMRNVNQWSGVVVLVAVGCLVQESVPAPASSNALITSSIG